MISHPVQLKGGSCQKGAWQGHSHRRAWPALGDNFNSQPAALRVAACFGNFLPWYPCDNGYL